MPEISSKGYTEVPVRNSGESTIGEEEKDTLLEGQSYLRRGWKRSSSKAVWCIVALLVLSNIGLLGGLIHYFRQTYHIEVQIPWLPPKTAPTGKVFVFQTLYGEPLSPEAEKAWDELMPNQPGLDQSLPEQRAMISVFHQLHCLVSNLHRPCRDRRANLCQYMTREGYYAAREGNVDQVNAAHLMHCWDYLRQSVMCNADTTLEWVPAPPNDKGSTGWGYEHTCRDFDAIAQWAEENRLKTTYGIH